MKVKIVNCEDGQATNCFLTHKKFKTSKGVAFMLNGKAIDPEVALKNYEIEFADDFIVPANFNSRVKVGEYLNAIGIKRNHPSYLKIYDKLGENLPLGELKYEKGENTFNKF